MEPMGTVNYHNLLLFVGSDYEPQYGIYRRNPKP